jgi:hypothetical protein
MEGNRPLPPEEQAGLRCDDHVDHVGRGRDVVDGERQPAGADQEVATTDATAITSAVRGDTRLANLSGTL